MPSRLRVSVDKWLIGSAIQVNYLPFRQRTKPQNRLNKFQLPRTVHARKTHDFARPKRKRHVLHGPFAPPPFYRYVFEHQGFLCRRKGMNTGAGDCGVSVCFTRLFSAHHRLGK